MILYAELNQHEERTSLFDFWFELWTFGTGEQNSRYFVVSEANGATRCGNKITRVLFSGAYKDVRGTCLCQNFADWTFLRIN